jgi:Tannase and feruloyl esterase
VSLTQSNPPATDQVHIEVWLATETNSKGAVTETRPLCAYPDGAVYNGSGSLDEAANFHCAPTFAGPGT